jgi:hypothetical protein
VATSDAISLIVDTQIVASSDENLLMKEQDVESDSSAFF